MPTGSPGTTEPTATAAPLAPGSVAMTAPSRGSTMSPVTWFPLASRIGRETTRSTVAPSSMPSASAPRSSTESPGRAVT